jgi:hypothetical protein
MYLHTDGAGDNVLLPIERGEHIVSDLHIVCHKPVPPVVHPVASHDETFPGATISRLISAVEANLKT